MWHWVQRWDQIAQVIALLAFFGMVIWGVFCYAIIKIEERRQ